MSNRIRCNVKSWDETRRALAALADGIDGLDGSMGDMIGETPWTSYTCTWTGSTGDPGTNAFEDIFAYWKSWGNTVLVSVMLIIGSDPSVVASGTWRFSLPRTAATGMHLLGSAFISHNAVVAEGASPPIAFGSSNHLGVCAIETGATYMTVIASATTVGPVTDVFPNFGGSPNWNAEDQVIMTCTYPGVE